MFSHETSPQSSSRKETVLNQFIGNLNNMHSNKQNSCQKDHFPKHKAQVKYWAFLIFGCLLILFGFLYSGYTIFHSWSLISIHGRAILLNSLPLPKFIILTSFAIGIAIIIYQANHHNDSILISKECLIIHDGKKIITIRWQEITRMDTRLIDYKFGRTIIYSNREIVLKNTEHKQVFIRDRYVEMQELINNIRARAISHLYMDAVKKMNGSTPIPFHKHLLADNQGLKFEQQSIPWHSLQTPEIHRNQLIIRDHDPEKQIHINIKLSKIKNLDLLLLLCEKLSDEAQLSPR